VGSVYFGVPKDLVCFLRKEYEISDFIETGTYYGSSAAWASDYFNQVYTIELSKDLYEAAKERYKTKTNIHFLHGTSADVLSSIIGAESSPAIFWLDAHWSGGATAGDNERCPLLNEIKIILDSNPEHLIVVDDARFILAFPPETVKQLYDLPSYEDVLKILNMRRERYSIIWHDVLISVPFDKKETLYEFVSAQGHVFFRNSDITPRKMSYYLLKYYVYKMLLLVIPSKALKIKALKYERRISGM
jgi:hypothetical protein